MALDVQLSTGRSRVSGGYSRSEGARCSECWKVESRVDRRHRGPAALSNWTVKNHEGRSSMIQNVYLQVLIRFAGRRGARGAYIRLSLDPEYLGRERITSRSASAITESILGALGALGRLYEAQGPAENA